MLSFRNVPHDSRFKSIEELLNVEGLEIELIGGNAIQFNNVPPEIQKILFGGSFSETDENVSEKEPSVSNEDSESESSFDLGDFDENTSKDPKKSKNDAKESGEGQNKAMVRKKKPSVFKSSNESTNSSVESVTSKDPKECSKKLIKVSKKPFSNQIVYKTDSLKGDKLSQSSISSDSVKKEKPQKRIEKYISSSESYKSSEDDETSEKKSISSCKSFKSFDKEEENLRKKKSVNAPKMNQKSIAKKIKINQRKNQFKEDKKKIHQSSDYESSEPEEEEEMSLKELSLTPEDKQIVLKKSYLNKKSFKNDNLQSEKKMSKILSKKLPKKTDLALDFLKKNSFFELVSYRKELRKIVKKIQDLSPVKFFKKFFENPKETCTELFNLQEKYPKEILMLDSIMKKNELWKENFLTLDPLKQKLQQMIQNKKDIEKKKGKSNKSF